MADKVIDQALGILGAVAPTIATAFGGPLAGLVVKTVETAFGLAPNGGMQAAAAALANATPDQLLALRKVDDDVKSAHGGARGRAREDRPGRPGQRKEARGRGEG